MSATDYLEAKVLDHALRNTAFSQPAALYLALHTADPGDTGTASEVAGGSYARQTIAFAASSGTTPATAASSGAVNFAGMPAVTITHFSIRDAVSAGNSLFTGGPFVSDLVFLRSDSGATDHIRLRLSNLGALSVLRSVLGIGVSSANGVIAAGSWYYVELQVKLHDTTGFATVRVNGTVVASGTNIDTKNAGTKTVFDTIDLAFVSGASSSIWDDLILQSGDTCSFLGDVAVVTVVAAAGTTSITFGASATATVAYPASGATSIAFGAIATATVTYPASGATSLTFDASAVATSIVAPVDEHLIEYPAGSGRLYHRRDDGAVLRAETLIDGTWRDLTCDVIECSIRTGDTSGTTLVPTAEAGQAQITLRDVDGRYGPIPPTGLPLYQRWKPVRVWVGYVSDPDHPPTDDATRYGFPGAYRSTPPEFYGGYPRTVHADGIDCIFSGWLMSQERDPMADSLVTNWTCGDGLVRLVDQEVPDYNDTATSDADWPRGLRDGAPGNYRVSTLVGFVHSPAGTGYSTVVEATASHRMMQSPGGKVLDLVNKVASSDLAYFWWQPAVDPVDHDGFGDYFTYQPFDTITTVGLEWFVDCDHIEATAIDEVSDDNNFYSDVKATKGITKRTNYLPQPPWSGRAFDDLHRQIAYTQWHVQPGESYGFKLQLQPNVDKLSVETWVRFPALAADWTKVGQQTITNEPSTDLQATSSGTKVVVEAIDNDSLMEVLLRGKAMAPVLTPGHLADNVTLVVERGQGNGPEVIIDDPSLSDEAEVHEYSVTDLMLRYQTDVEDWATWVVRRSKTRRYTLTNLATTPEVGNPAWSWALWHGVWLGDRCTVEVRDGPTVVDTEWLRGVEWRIADVLEMTLHLEDIPAPMVRLADSGLRSTTPTVIPAGSVPFAGGHIEPAYQSPPELPDWAVPSNIGHGLIVSDDGSLQWRPNAGDVTWPIRTAGVPNLRVELNRTWPDEVRFYLQGPSEAWSNQGEWLDRENPTHSYSSRIVQYPFPQGWLALDSFPLSNDPYDGTAPNGTGANLALTFNEIAGRVYQDMAADDPHYPGDCMRGVFGVRSSGYGGAAELGALGTGHTESGFVAHFGAPEATSPTVPYAAVRAVNDDQTHATEGEVTPDVIRVTGPPHTFIEETPWTPVGQLEVLASSSGADPTVTQYQRQVGVATVTFSAGVGSITVPVTMGATRVAHATVVGTTVGGPMVAQIDTTTTTLTLYLSTAYSGALTVAWSVDHDAVPVAVTVSVELGGKRERQLLP